MVRIFRVIAVFLSCCAAAAAQTASVSQDSFDFGEIEVLFGSSPQTVTVENIGTETLEITGMSMIPGTEFAAFSTCDFVLDPSETCDIDLVFEPKVVGPNGANLQIELDHGQSGVLNVTLTGYGTKPALNDDIANATALPATFTETITIFNATTDPTDPSPTACEYGHDSRNHTVWYSFTAPSDGWLAVNNHYDDDFDSVLSIWTGSPGNLLPYACDDSAHEAFSPSLLQVPVAAGNKYYVMMSGSTPADAGILTFQSLFQTDQAIHQQEVTQASVMPGQTANFKVVTQFDDTTGLTVSVSPATSTIACTANPANLAFLGTGSTRFALVQVNCTTLGPSAFLGSQPTNPWIPLLGIGSLAAMLWIPTRKNWIIGAALLACFTLSCGGGGGGSQSFSSGGGTTSGTTTGSTTGTTNPPPSTAAGTYTVQLSGSEHSVVSSPLTLTVH